MISSTFQGKQFEKHTLRLLQLLFNTGRVLKIDPCCFTYQKNNGRILDFIIELPFYKRDIQLIQTIQSKSYAYTSIWKHGPKAFHDAIQDNTALQLDKQYSQSLVARPILYNKYPKSKWPKHLQNDSQVIITDNLSKTIEGVIHYYNQRPGDPNFPTEQRDYL